MSLSEMAENRAFGGGVPKGVYWDSLASAPALSAHKFPLFPHKRTRRSREPHGGSVPFETCAFAAMCWRATRSPRRHARAMTQEPKALLLWRPLGQPRGSVDPATEFRFIQRGSPICAKEVPAGYGWLHEVDLRLSCRTFHRAVISRSIRERPNNWPAAPRIGPNPYGQVAGKRV